MEFKGTKGEWSYDINANKGFDVYLDGSIKTIATVLFKGVSYMPNEKEAQANAQLIASAPEMFEMLKKLLESRLKFEIDYIEIEQLLTKITSND